jgi:hypothetical protein
MTVDMRTRPIDASGPSDPTSFFGGAWCEVPASQAHRAAEDAARLELTPITLRIDDDPWIIEPCAETITATPGSGSELAVTLDSETFADFFCERRTALGIVVGGRAGGTPAALEAFCAWDPVLRSLLDGRFLYRTGDIDLRSMDGTPLDLHRRFRLGEETTEAAHFLAEAGFLLLEDMFTQAEMDEIDTDLAVAVEAARSDDGSSWWATTAAGEAYPCRILDLASTSPAVRALIADERYVAIGEILDDGHHPGDPFGEHFTDVTAEGLLKRVDSVDGLVCLPWHKDCDRGGHSMFCSGLTIGICLTPVDEAHGGLDVMAGSHRANIARAQIDRELDLPAVALRAGRGDVTVHMSCTLHRSTHPTTHERRVVYTGFALPSRSDGRSDGRSEDRHAEDAQPRLRRERAAIGDSNGRQLFASGGEP